MDGESRGPARRASVLDAPGLSQLLQTKREEEPKNAARNRDLT